MSDSGDTDEGSADTEEVLTKNTRMKDIFSDDMKSSGRGFTTDWGPIGFKKALHPLSIMVCNFSLVCMSVRYLLSCRLRIIGRIF